MSGVVILHTTERMGKKSSVGVIEIEVVETNDSAKSSKTKKERKTSPYMTKYEFTRLISARAMQISISSDPCLDEDEEMMEPLEIAKKELYERTIPWVIIRKLPDGSEEIWHVKDMHIMDY